jgi:hypothetical protein
MQQIINVSSDISKAYMNNGFWGSVTDRFKISLEDISFIRELGLNVANVRLPPNFHKEAYLKNIRIARNIVKNSGNSYIAPRTFRRLDYCIFTDFQKKLMAYSVVKSIQLLLRITHLSIKNSCIVLYDAADGMNIYIINELAKYCTYMVFLSNDIKSTSNLRDYVIANYGVSPLLTNDMEYALNNADFIILSDVAIINNSIPTWYLNNTCMPKDKNKTVVNDVTYSIPWKFEYNDMNLELLGAILGQMEERDVDKALSYNGIYLNNIKFNKNILKYKVDKN